MSTTAERPKDVARAVTGALDAMAEKVAVTLRAEVGGDLNFDELARKVMYAAGIVDAETIKMWDPLAIAGVKADLIVVADGMNVTVVRRDPADPGMLERPPSTVTLHWGDKGRAPKWISGIQISKIGPPKGRSA